MYLIGHISCLLIPRFGCGALRRGVRYGCRPGHGVAALFQQEGQGSFQAPPMPLRKEERRLRGLRQVQRLPRRHGGLRAAWGPLRRPGWLRIATDSAAGHLADTAGTA